MTTKTQTTLLSATFLIAMISFSISGMENAFASSDSSTGPWDKNQEIPNSTSGDERAIANSSGDSFIYANLDCCATFTDHDAHVRHNVDSSGVDSSPSLFVGAGASKIFLDIEFAYDGHITADAPGGEAILWLEGRLYKDGSLDTIFGDRIDGAGDKTSSSDTRTWSQNHSGSHTYKAASGFEADTRTFLFGGHQQVEFWDDPHHIQTLEITVRT